MTPAVDGSYLGKTVVVFDLECSIKLAFELPTYDLLLIKTSAIGLGIRCGFRFSL